MTPNTKGLIYVPEINLHFTEERILLGKNWQATKDILKNQEKAMPTQKAMPTPYQFRAFLKTLRDSPEHQELYNDITEDRDSWRANWLNARFERRKDGMYMTSEDTLTNGEYQNQILKLNDYLMEDKQISLDEYLDSTTLHGLPPANIQKVQKGSLHYGHITNGRVAGFGAIWGMAGRGCSRVPGYSDPAIGVFACTQIFSKDSTTLEIEIQEKLYSKKEIKTAIDNAKLSGLTNLVLKQLK